MTAAMLKSAQKKPSEAAGMKILNGAKDPMANVMLGVRLNSNPVSNAGRSPGQPSSMTEMKLQMGKAEAFDHNGGLGHVRYPQNPSLSPYSAATSGVGNLPYFQESTTTPQPEMKLSSYPQVGAYGNQSAPAMAPRSTNSGPSVNGVAHMNQFGPNGFSTTDHLGPNQISNGHAGHFAHNGGPMGNSNSSPLLLKLLRSNSPTSSEHPLPPTNANDIDDFIIETTLQQQTPGNSQQQFFPPDDFQLQQQQHNFHQTPSLDQSPHAYTNSQQGGPPVRQFVAQPSGIAATVQNSKLPANADQYTMGGMPSPTNRHFYLPHQQSTSHHPQQQHFGEPQGMSVGPTPYDKLLPFDCNPDISVLPSKKKRRLKKKTTAAEAQTQHQVNNHFYNHEGTGMIMQPQTSYYPDSSQYQNYPMLKQQQVELRSDSQLPQSHHYNVVDHNVHTATSSSHQFMQNCYGPNGEVPAGAYSNAPHPAMDVNQPSQTNSKAKNPRKPRQNEKKGGRNAAATQQLQQSLSQMPIPMASNFNGDQQTTFLQPSLPKKSKLSLDTQKQIAEDPFVQSAIDSVLSSVRASSGGMTKVTRPNGFASYHSECDNQVNGYSKSPETDRGFGNNSDEMDRSDSKSATVRVSVEHFVSSMEKVVARADEMIPHSMQQEKRDTFDPRDFRVPNLYFDHGDFLNGGFDMNVGDFLAGDIDVIMSDSGRSAGSDPPGSTSQQGAESNGEMTSNVSTQLGKLSGCFLPTNDVAAVQKDCGVRSVSSTTSSSPHLCTNDSTSPLVNGGGSGQLSNGPVAGVDERANKPSPPPSATDGSGTATIGSQNFVVSFGAVAV